MNVLKKNMVRAALSMIGSENIQKSTDEIVQTLLAKKKDVQLEDGEKDVAVIIYEVAGKAYFATVTTSEDENQAITIRRYLSVNEVSKFVDIILNQVENS